MFTKEENDVGIEDVDIDCTGLEREEQVHIPVMRINENGQNLTKNICHNINPMDCMEDKCLGVDHVGVFIMEPWEKMLDMGSTFSLRLWPITCVFHQRYILAHRLLVSTNRLRAQSTFQKY